MRILIALLSFPALLWAYYKYPLLSQLSWKWLLAAFLVYCFLLLKICVRILESPEKYGVGRGGMGSGGGFFDGGGDCGGGGGDC